MAFYFFCTSVFLNPLCVTSSQQCFIALVLPKGMLTLIATNLATNKVCCGRGEEWERQSFQYLNFSNTRHLSPESRSEEYANMAFMHTIGVRCMLVGWGYIYAVLSVVVVVIELLYVKLTQLRHVRYAVSLLVLNIDECMYSMCIADGVYWVGERGTE